MKFKLPFVLISEAFTMIEKHGGRERALNLGAGTKPNPKCFAEYHTVDRVDFGLPGTDYTPVDLNRDPLPFPDDTFDVVVSFNVLEHLWYPWKVAKECIRVCKPGGLNVHISPFAWRYHPVPEDYFRFSHSAMASLFEETQVEVLGYDIQKRRRVQKGLYEKDQPPFDTMGGWLESWETVFVGRKG